MTRILFVCLGNICRSPMAEFVLKDLVSERGMVKAFQIASAGTSSKEQGNPVHPGTRAQLQAHGISCAGKTARKIRKEDYDEFDWLLCMEEKNVQNLLRFFGGDPQRKIRRLLDYTQSPRDIADPWYTGNFDATWQDVKEGCEGLLLALSPTQKPKQPFES